MKNAIRWAALAVGFLATSQAALALEGAAHVVGAGVTPIPVNADRPKAASTQTLGSRATVTPSATMYGGFELAQQATVYVLVRGNSLQTLGVTNNYLDAPRVRLYNAAGQDTIIDSFGRPGFNGCEYPPPGTQNDFTTLVINYYRDVRRQPVHPRDGCVAVLVQPGAYTFTVTPSIPGVTTTSGTSNPGSGEVLFEITLGPSS